MTKISYSILKIVGDGGMSNPHMGEGRFIPILIIDEEGVTDISDLIKLHQNTLLPGDVKMQWRKRFENFKLKSMILEIKFIQPMKIEFGILFDLKSQYPLVDGIIQSRAFYLRTGKEGDKVSDLTVESILIEVPEMGVDATWNDLLLKIVNSKYKKMGNSKKDSIIMAKGQIKSMREVWNIRRD